MEEEGGRTGTAASILVRRRIPRGKKEKRKSTFSVLLPDENLRSSLLKGKEKEGRGGGGLPQSGQGASAARLLYLG